MLMYNKTSMLHWYPKTRGIKDLLQPQTIMIEVNEEELLRPLLNMETEKLEEFRKSETFRKIKDAVEKVGTPFFMRTDMASGKHDWKRSCFCNSNKDADIISHLARVFEFNKIADIMGLPVHAIVIRKYIPMKNLFTAFHGEMPVNPEIRFFIKDGEILCWHWYWIEDAIRSPSVDNWKYLMKREKEYLSGNEILWLENDVRKIARVFPEGYWSIDFCKAKDNRWYFIDMAEGGKSWHPDCDKKVV